MPAVKIGTGTEQRGMIWSYGRIFFGGCNTILPPNREICLGDATAAAMHFEAIAPPGSRHQGGCHVLMADGAVKFITDSIDAGNSSSNSSNFNGALYLPCGVESPFGLWGKLGSRANKETIDTEF